MSREVLTVVGRIADELYLIAHDERSGLCRGAARAVQVGMAAALLAELVVSGHLGVVEGGLVPGPAPYPPVDRLLRETLALVETPRQDRAVEVWLRFLSLEAVADVRQRLLVDGFVQAVRLRRWWGGSSVRYLPTAPNRAAWPDLPMTGPNRWAWPAVRLALHLTSRPLMSVTDVVLACLVDATGLMDQVLWCKPDHTPGRARVREVRENLPIVSVDLASLVAHTDAVIGSRVLTHRTV